MQQFLPNGGIGSTSQYFSSQLPVHLLSAKYRLYGVSLALFDLMYPFYTVVASKSP